MELSQEKINEIIASLVPIYGFENKEQHFEWVNANFDKMVKYFNDRGIDINATNIAANKAELDSYLENAETEDYSDIASVLKNKSKGKLIFGALMIVVIYLIFIK
jgi:hypothetical protein